MKRGAKDSNLKGAKARFATVNPILELSQYKVLSCNGNYCFDYPNEK